MKKKELLKCAIERYGAASQTLMAFEEMAELQKELSKNARGNSNRAQIAEEIADVRIMLDQMEILHGCSFLAHGYEKAKLKRLADKLGVDYA